MLISVCLSAVCLRREKFLPWKPRTCLKFCVSKYIFEWHKAIGAGRGVIENMSHASRPSTFINDHDIERG